MSVVVDNWVEEMKTVFNSLEFNHNPSIYIKGYFLLLILAERRSCSDIITQSPHFSYQRDQILFTVSYFITSLHTSHRLSLLCDAQANILRGTCGSWRWCYIDVHRIPKDGNSHHSGICWRDTVRDTLQEPSNRASNFTVCIFFNGLNI